ncbi:MAG: polysaccharide deacetylase family protein, partial [Pseudomonadota bacterium]
ELTRGHARLTPMRRLALALAVLIAAAFGLLELSSARTFQLFGEVISAGPPDRPVVALTFDDGPTARHTPALLQMLADADVRATFFLIGQSVEQNPDMARAIVDAGHQIGNHSWDHPRMIAMSPRAVRSQITRTDAAMRAVGFDGPIAFRPPYGKKLVVLPWVLSDMGRPSVMWSMAPEDAVPPDAPAQALAQYVIDTARPGDIILLHGMYNSNARTRAALPAILAGLQARGFEFVTLEALTGAAR